MERLLADLTLIKRSSLAFAAFVILQVCTACVTPGTQGQAQPDFIAMNSYQYQNQFQNSYQNGNPNGYGGQAQGYAYRSNYRPFASSYSNNPYGQGYNSQANSPFDYGSQGLNGSYNQSPTGAYLDQSGTPITPLRDYLRDNLDRPNIQQTPTIYRPTAGFDQPNQSLDTWPSYNPNVQ